MPRFFRKDSSQSIEVDLRADVLVARRERNPRDDVVVVPATEVLVLQGGAVVQPGVKTSGG